MVKLTERKIKWVVNQAINKGESTAGVVAIYSVSRRKIQRLVKSYEKTEVHPVSESTISLWCTPIGSTILGYG